MAEFGRLVALVRQLFWPPGRVEETWSLARDASVVKQQLKKRSAGEVEAMIRGAHQLGWKDLRAINSADGLGRRIAVAAYWPAQNQRVGKLPEQVGAILKGML